MPEIDVTPPPSMIKKISKTGRSIGECISDFIENSYDAATPEQRSGKEDLVIDVSLTPTAITISDNASGMDFPGLSDAAVASKTTKDPKTDPWIVGQFGLGFKISGAAMGEAISVLTGVAGDSKLYFNVYDVGKMTRTGVWKTFIDTAENYPGYKGPTEKPVHEHGTKMRVFQLEPGLITKENLKSIEDDLIALYGRIYRSFPENVKLYINRRQIITEKVKWAPKWPEKEVITIPFGNVFVEGGIIDKSVPVQERVFGADLMYRCRSIVTDWSRSSIGIRNPLTHDHMRMFVRADFLVPTIDKKGVEISSPEYVAVRDAVRNSKTVKKINRAGDESFGEKRYKPSSEEKKLLNDAFNEIKNILQDPDVQRELDAVFPKEKTPIVNGTEGIPMVPPAPPEKEKDGKKGGKGGGGKGGRKHLGGGKTPYVAGGTGKKYGFTLGGSMVYWNHTVSSLGPGVRYRRNLDDKTGILNIVTNEDIPRFKESRGGTERVNIIVEDLLDAILGYGLESGKIPATQADKLKETIYTRKGSSRMV